MSFFFTHQQGSKIVEGKFVMDYMNAEANADYLTISASIDKSGSKPVANVYADLKKDVADILVKVTLNAEVAGELKEIYKAKDFNPCKDEDEDVRKTKRFSIQNKKNIINFQQDFLKYALDEMEKYGNLKIECPMKEVIMICFELGQSFPIYVSLKKLKELTRLDERPILREFSLNCLRDNLRKS